MRAGGLGRCGEGEPERVGVEVGREMVRPELGSGGQEGREASCGGDTGAQLSALPTRSGSGPSLGTSTDKAPGNANTQLR